MALPHGSYARLVRHQLTRTTTGGTSFAARVGARGVSARFSRRHTSSGGEEQQQQQPPAAP